MSEDKQIEEMHLTESEILANDIAQMCPDLVNSGCGDLSCTTCLAKGLEQIGYRKASEVAEEIFAEIESVLLDKDSPLTVWCAINGQKYAELKKKYTEEGK